MHNLLTGTEHASDTDTTRTWYREDYLAAMRLNLHAATRIPTNATAAQEHLRDRMVAAAHTLAIAAQSAPTKPPARSAHHGDTI